MKIIIVSFFFYCLFTLKPLICIAQSGNFLQHNFYARGGVVHSSLEVDPNTFNYKQFIHKPNSTDLYIEVGYDMFWNKHMGVGLGLRRNGYTYYVKTQPFMLPLFGNSYAEFWFKYWNIALPVNFLYKVHNQNGSNFRINLGLGPSMRFLWTSIEHRSLYAPGNIEEHLLGISSDTDISFKSKYSVDFFGGIAYYFPTNHRLNFAIGLDIQKKFVKVPRTLLGAVVFDVTTGEFEATSTPLDANNAPLFLNFYLQIGLKSKKQSTNRAE